MSLLYYYVCLGLPAGRIRPLRSWRKPCHRREAIGGELFQVLAHYEEEDSLKLRAAQFVFETWLKKHTPPVGGG